jgi:hypothetical protein
MNRNQTRFQRRGLWAFVCVAILAAPASASTLYHHDLDPNHTLFGNLKQTDVPGCGNGLFACGPTAAVNSFAFLQNKFPDIYDHKLIPDSNMNNMIDYDELKETALALGGMDYMMCAECDGGTKIGNFINGKRKWINERAPGTTIFKDDDLPQWQFLWRELWDMEDVELLLGFYKADGSRLGGHYVTLTKFWWEDTNMNDIIDETNAMIGFVDPADGTMKMQSLFNPPSRQDLFTDYGVGLSIDNMQIASTRIDWAVSESPVPEPAAFVLVVMALGCVGIKRSRRT